MTKRFMTTEVIVYDDETIEVDGDFINWQE